MDNQREIFDAVKADDIKLFTDFVQKDRSVLQLCFGRFPLLSLCYLYKARKIIRFYEKQLNASTYIYVAEERVYEDFRAQAQKSVRFYTEEGAIVSPLEMLAALNSPRLSAVYPVLRKTETIKANILKIYQSIHGQEISLTNESIAFPKAPLTRIKKAIIAAIVVVALIFSSAPLISRAAIENSLGKGIESSPYAISNINQLESMFKGENNSADKYYSLKKDITLNGGGFAAGDFAGVLDGQGATICINNPVSAFISTLTGTLKNINFVFAVDAEVTESASYIAAINDGTLDNVSATFSGRINLSGSTKIEVSCFVGTNNGTIKNCSFSPDIHLTCGEESGGAFGGFAFYNNGVIENCSLESGSRITSDTVDLAGVAVANRGLVTGCVNNAAISQTTSRDYWNAIATGIALENYATVYGCENSGSISVASTGQTTNRIEVFASGIVYVNLNLIEKCKNSGPITAFSKAFYVYAGGIVAYNASGAVRNCGSSGVISLSSDATESIELYGGGIAGYNGITAEGGYITGYGRISDSYSTVIFESGNTNASFGGATGLWYNIIDLPQYYEAQHTNNYYLKGANFSFGAGTYIEMGVSFEVTTEFGGLNGVETLEELQATGVFW